MATVLLPDSLARLFPGSPRRCEVQAATVAELLNELDQRWPGMRDRLCDGSPAIREHIAIFVDGERASLETLVAYSSEVMVMPALTGG